MKKLLLILLCLPFIGFGQGSLNSAISGPIEYTQYKDANSIKEYWKNNPGEIDEMAGIYECISSGGDRSLNVYEFAVIKEKDIYKFISIGGKWGLFDVKKGGVKLVSREIDRGIYQVKWRMALASSKVSGSYTRQGKLLTFNLDVPTANSFQFIKTFSPIDGDIESVSGSGTGFALNSKGYIATNYHVINSSSKIIVRGIKGDFNTKHDASVVVVDKNNDLAIIKVNTNLGNVPYKIKSKNSDVATEVYALGYPLRASMGDELKFTKGDISAKSGFQGDITSYQHTIAVQPGNSGGPMFDVDGYLVGVINAKHRGAENASYSVKSKYLLNLIDESSENIPHSTTNLMYKKSVKDQVKLIRDFIYIIEVN